MESPPLFNSVEDECRYWKERAKLYHKEWTDVKQEYDEYVEQSRQMEAEMDTTLEQKQRIIKELKMTMFSVEKENDSLKRKIESYSLEFANLELQLDNVKKERDSMKEYLRQLEQKNDDLERAHRILNESIVDFERMLDKAYEKNALLEMEVDEKEILQEKLQRLMDETRDLKQELNVKSRYTPNGTMNNSLNSTTPISNGLVSNGDIVNECTATTITNNLNNCATINYNQQHSLKNPDNLLNGNAMTASSRTTALNIVADMLRKLNLDKALLCSVCDKFRCVCDQPASSENRNNQNPIRLNSTGTHDSRISNTASNTDITRHTSPIVTTTTNDDGVTADSTLKAGRSTSSLNFGTNIFKRFAERFGNNTNTLFNSAPTATSTVIYNHSNSNNNNNNNNSNSNNGSSNSCSSRGNDT